MSQPPQGPPPGQGGWGPPGPSPYGPPAQSSRSGRAGRKGLLIGGAAVLVVAAVGGGVWAATAWFGTGSQAAEALPDDLIAYVGVDLDPSGGQKLEALRTLEKFPIIADNSDLDSDTDSDLKEAFFDTVQSSGEGCEGLDYDDDLGAWIGDRAGFGVMPGEDEPDVVVAVQVTDAGAAEDGLTALANCAASGSADEEAGSDGGDFGYVVDGDWAIVAESDAIAQDVVDSAADGALAADEDYQRWTDAAGDPGILAAYAAPGLVDEIEDGLGPEAGAFGAALEDFEGAALAVRFADEGVEVETAGVNGLYGTDALLGSANAADVVAGLPDDTAAVFAVGFEDGWGDEVLDQISELSGLSADDLAAEAEAELGIEVPADLETLLGQGAAISVSRDLDIEGLADGSTPPDEAMLGLRIRTDDPEAAEGVLDELRGTLPDDALVVSETEDDLLVVSPDDGYRSSLLEDGDLAGQDRFADALPEADRSGSLLYVDLDVIDDYAGLIDDLSGDGRVSENLAPLAAIGLSSWSEDDAAHSLLRISTD